MTTAIETHGACDSRFNAVKDAFAENFPTRFGLGFILTMPDARLGPNPRTFGHPGMGGSLGFADPDAKVGFGYVMNKMIATPDLIDPRWPSLIDAVYASL